jgi:DNA-binding MarR family transcriptional regulator
MKTSNETELVHLEARVRSEYNEMPGLSLAPAQAARLWALDRSLSERVLDRLVDAGFLRRTREGLYLRPSERRPW